ncbi:hypothetical protein C8R48DRAFT_751630 [Suillus tomentosus]|nr:hypothetical protein C8R48DRAFT_751630 [Suillus tomentosus]
MSTLFHSAKTCTLKVKDFLWNKCKILVIGAGGLGCEILANLALTGFKDIHLIDMDTMIMIDISNLNRQFLFRPADVGRPKAIVAAEHVMKRVPGVKVTSYYGKIQDKGDDYYLQSNLVICGLDFVEACPWINATLVNLVDPANPESFKGQARVILPTRSSCFECSLDILNKPTTFPICTIANTPRLPEHRIEWASVLEWPHTRGGQSRWTSHCSKRNSILMILSTSDGCIRLQQQFKIEGVTGSLTQGVFKNVIPAIASNNAIIAASSCNEAFKIATSSAAYLNNYFMLIGTEGTYSYTFEHEKRDHCPVCGGEALEMSIMISRDWTVEQLIELLTEKQNIQIKKASLATPEKPIYFHQPPQLEEATRPNLEKRVAISMLDAAGGNVDAAASLLF